MTGTGLPNGAERLRVTASVAGVGIAEAQNDIQPVDHATIELGRATVYTNAAGLATVTVGHSERVKITAGDTLNPTSIFIRGR